MSRTVVRWKPRSANSSLAAARSRSLVPPTNNCLKHSFQQGKPFIFCRGVTRWPLEEHRALCARRRSSVPAERQAACSLRPAMRARPIPLMLLALLAACAPLRRAGPARRAAPPPPPPPPPPPLRAGGERPSRRPLAARAGHARRRALPPPPPRALRRLAARSCRL